MACMFCTGGGRITQLRRVHAGPGMEGEPGFGTARQQQLQGALGGASVALPGSNTRQYRFVSGSSAALLPAAAPPPPAAQTDTSDGKMETDGNRMAQLEPWAAERGNTASTDGADASAEQQPAEAGHPVFELPSVPMQPDRRISGAPAPAMRGFEAQAPPPLPDVVSVLLSAATAQQQQLSPAAEQRSINLPQPSAEPPAPGTYAATPQPAVVPQLLPAAPAPEQLGVQLPASPPAPEAALLLLAASAARPPSPEELSFMLPAPQAEGGARYSCQRPTRSARAHPSFRSALCATPPTPAARPPPPPPSRTLPPLSLPPPSALPSPPNSHACLQARHPPPKRTSWSSCCALSPP